MSSQETPNLSSIQEQIKALQAQAESIISSKRAEVIAAIRQQMQEYQLSTSDIDGPAKAKAPKTGVRGVSDNPAPAKYRGPTGETWSGRGLKPRWLSAEIESGKTKEDFLITAPSA